MGLSKKIIFGALFLALATGGLLYFASGITDVSLEGFALTGLSELSQDSFTLTGTLSISNPSRMAVPITDTTYRVVLDDTNQTLSQGALAPFTLEADAVTETVFEQEIAWVPTAQLLARLLLQDEVYVTVSGNATATFLFFSHTIPFEDRIDIKAYLVEQSGTQELAQTVSSTRDAVNNATDGALDDLTRSLGFD